MTTLTISKNAAISCSETAARFFNSPAGNGSGAMQCAGASGGALAAEAMRFGCWGWFAAIVFDAFTYAESIVGAGASIRFGGTVSATFLNLKNIIPPNGAVENDAYASFQQ